MPKDQEYPLDMDEKPMEFDDYSDDDDASTAYGNSPAQSDDETDNEFESILPEKSFITKTRLKQKPKKVKRGKRHEFDTKGAFIARSVGKDEMNGNAKAIASQVTEWSKLWDQKVWDDSMFKSYNNVRYEAQRAGRDIHIGK